MNKKDYTLEGKIIGYLRWQYPTTRINNIISLNDYDEYYSVKCDVTELFSNVCWEDVSTFIVSKKAIENYWRYLAE